MISLSDKVTSVEKNDFLRFLRREGDKVTRGTCVELTVQIPVTLSLKFLRGTSTLSGGLGFTALNYSHSIVPGGLLVISKTTLLTPSTSLTIRLEIFSKTAYGKRDQSAVIPSSLETQRTTIGHA